MGYGEGRSLLYADKAEEEWFEQDRLEKELKAAEDAASKESKGSSVFSLLGSTLGAAAGFFYGGLKGASTGWSTGGELAKWGRKGIKKVLGTAYDAKDHALSTDMGTFDVSKGADIEEINRDFEEAQKAQFWKDITGTGATLLTLGGMKSTGIDWLDKWMSPVVQNEGAELLDFQHELELKGHDIGTRVPSYFT
jgi:hypothetical protein